MKETFQNNTELKANIVLTGSPSYKTTLSFTEDGTVFPGVTENRKIVPVICARDQSIGLGFFIEDESGKARKGLSVVPVATDLPRIWRAMKMLEISPVADNHFLSQCLHAADPDAPPARFADLARAYNCQHGANIRKTGTAADCRTHDARAKEQTRGILETAARALSRLFSLNAAPASGAEGARAQAPDAFADTPFGRARHLILGAPMPYWSQQALEHAAGLDHAPHNRRLQTRSRHTDMTANAAAHKSSGNEMSGPS